MSLSLSLSRSTVCLRPAYSICRVSSRRRVAVVAVPDAAAAAAAAAGSLARQLALSRPPTARSLLPRSDPRDGSCN